MRKRIEFSDGGEAYLLKQVEPPVDNAEVAIQKATLEFDTKKFYKAFFEGLSEKPEIEFVRAGGSNLDKSGEFIFGELNDLISKICGDIKEEWFVAPDASVKEWTESNG